MATSFEQQPSTVCYSRSPIIYSIFDSENGNTGFKYVLDVFIWNGDSTATPGTYNYRLKKSPNINGYGVFDISGLVNALHGEKRTIYDVTGWEGNGEQALNILCQAGYETDATASLANTNSSLAYALPGYTYFDEGINASNSTDVPFSNQPNTLSVKSNGYAVMPVAGISIGSVAKAEVTTTSGSSQLYEASGLGGVGSENRFIYFGFGPQNLADSGFDTSGENYTLELQDSGGSALATFNVVPTCEPKYDVYTIWFINKYGLWDFLTCFKKSTQTINTKRSNYLRSIAVESSGVVSYNTEDASMATYNVNGMEQIVVNTGYQEEGIDELVKQLFLSEQTNIEIDGTFLPVRVTENSKQIQSGVNDKLINYTLTLEYAFNKVNIIQ